MCKQRFYGYYKIDNARHVSVFLLRIQNKKHAKVQNFMQIHSKILSLHALIFY